MIFIMSMLTASKQAIPKVAESYAKLGIRFSVIVDFDALRSQGEFRDLLLAMNIDARNLDRLLGLQEEIAKEIESTDKAHLLRDLINKLDELKARISTGHSQGNPDGTLLEARRELKRIRDDSSPYCRYKISGYAALTIESQRKFSELDTICREYGTFLVPVGELESWLTNYEVERLSNKSKWIANALMKLHEIHIHETDPLGKFIIAIHEYLLKEA